MILQNKKVIGALSAAVVLFTFFSGVSAANIKLTPKPTKAVKEGTESGKMNAVKKQCEILQDRIDTQVQHYRYTKEAHFRFYDETVDMLEKLLTKLDTKGYDTKAARTKVEELKTKTANLQTEIDKIISDLGAAKTVSCTDPKTNKAKLQLVRSQVKAVYTAEHALVKYYKDEVRKAVVQLKDQAKLTPKPSETEND